MEIRTSPEKKSYSYDHKKENATAKTRKSSRKTPISESIEQEESLEQESR